MASLFCQTSKASKWKEQGALAPIFHQGPRFREIGCLAKYGEYGEACTKCFGKMVTDFSQVEGLPNFCLGDVVRAPPAWFLLTWKLIWQGFISKAKRKRINPRKQSMCFKTQPLGMAGAPCSYRGQRASLHEHLPATVRSFRTAG